MKKAIVSLSCVLLLLGCTGNRANYYNSEYAEFSDENTEFEYVSEKNDDSEYLPKSAAETELSANRWNTSRQETRWQEYHGTMVRVQILLGSTELREMRLRLMQNADGMDIDADSRTVLARVADYEMKRVCGRNVKTIQVVYDKPSFEAMRPTPYFDYRIEAEGATMREYGFKCVYNQSK